MSLNRRELRRLFGEIVDEEEDAERACFQLADTLEEWGDLIVQNSERERP